MPKKAKAKPMRVWVAIEKKSGEPVCVRRAGSLYVEQFWGKRVNIVEFVAVTPRKRQKGKRKPARRAGLEVKGE